MNNLERLTEQAGQDLSAVQSLADAFRKSAKELARTAEMLQKHVANGQKALRRLKGTGRA